MAIGLILGGLLSAGGPIAGGLLSQEKAEPGSRILPTVDPLLDLGLQSTNFDALNGLGFGDIFSLPSPSRQLVGQIHTLPIDEKTKRRGLVGLQQFFSGEEVQPVFEPFIDAVLSRVGITRSDLDGIAQRDADFKRQQEELSSLSGINTSTVLERARTAQAAAQILGGAAKAASGGELSPIQQDIRDRLERDINAIEERSLLQAQHGGFNPALALEGTNNMRADLDLKSIEQSLLLASGLSGGLGSGLNSALASSGQLSNASLGALGIAANQANAANALNAQINSNNATSLGNGAAGAFGSLGSSLTTVGLLNRFGSGGTAPASGGQSFGTGFGGGTGTVGGLNTNALFGVNP